MAMGLAKTADRRLIAPAYRVLVDWEEAYAVEFGFC